MNGTKRPIYYWDSCIFISWVKGEQRLIADDMEGIKNIIEKLKKRDVVIITSTITRVEVAACNVGRVHLPRFDELLSRKNILSIAVDIKISNLARTLRDYYRDKPLEVGKNSQQGPKTLCVPDAIHLATAIMHKVDCFHTFDKKNRKGSLGLLPLNNNVAGHVLKIEKPKPDAQRRMI